MTKHDNFRKKDFEILEEEKIQKIIESITEKDIIKMASEYGLRNNGNTYGVEVSIIADIRDGRVFAHNYQICGKDADIIFEHTIATIRCNSDDDVEAFYANSDSPDQWKELTQEDLDAELTEYNYFSVDFKNEQDLFEMYETVNDK